MEQVIKIEQLVVGKLYLAVAPNYFGGESLIGDPHLSDRFKMLEEPYDYTFTFSKSGVLGKFFKVLMLQTQKVRHLSVLDCGILSESEPTYHNNHRTFTCSDAEWKEVKYIRLSDFLLKYKIQ